MTVPLACCAPQEVRSLVNTNILEAYKDAQEYVKVCAWESSSARALVVFQSLSPRSLRILLLAALCARHGGAYLL